MPKTDCGGSNSYYRVSDSHNGVYDSTFSDEYPDKKVTEHNEYNEASYYDVVQKYEDRINILLKNLSQLHFQPKVIEFTNDFVYRYNPYMIKDNEQEINVLQNDKYSFCYSVPICNILIMNDHAPFWHMSRKKAKYSPKKTEIPISSWVYVFYDLKIKQGIQGSS